MAQLFPPDPLIRLPLYIITGLMTEVLFTGIVDLIHPLFLQSWNTKNRDKPNPLRRDPKAMGYTFLWMIPLYATMIFIEPLSQYLQSWSIWMRGFVYLACFWSVEYVGGTFIKKLTGRHPWDYSHSRFSLHGHIRWDFAPVWYFFSLFVEKMSVKFVAITPAIKALWN